MSIWGKGARTGVTPDFLGKIFLFGLLVTIISAGANALSLINNCWDWGDE